MTGGDCFLPAPDGWRCSRPAGHAGQCAAWQGVGRNPEPWITPPRVFTAVLVINGLLLVASGLNTLLGHR